MMNQTAAQAEPLRQRQSAELTPPDSQTSKRKFSEITAVDPRPSKKREYDRAYRLRVKEQKTSVEAENAVLKQEIESLKNKIASVSQERDEFKKENVELKQKLIKKSEKIQQLKSDLKNKEVENGELKNDLIKSLKQSNALVIQPFETQSNEPDQRRSEYNIEKQFRIAGNSTNFTRDFGQYSIVETEGRSMHSTVAMFKVNK
ncbi:hypothetical protein SLEP1_g53737 [Rubroshorea leprosula]|uniref:Uncharacterized protein n=1 Tax=Rubroshorea leprosula TaxID=152421 RepID=A0AAV5MB91_9ROSI|nr:hypothetical protein SLEP1_g53737 [Rubroshorea leprosula]